MNTSPYTPRGSDPIGHRGMRFVTVRDLQKEFGPHYGGRCTIAECQHGMVTVLVPPEELADARALARFIHLHLLERGVRVLRLTVRPTLAPESPA